MGHPSSDADNRPTSAIRLTDEQLAVVHAPPDAGHLLVMAAPGSGKTRVIIERIRWLLNEGHATPEQILAVTFTRQAANELNERIAADRGAAWVWAGTFHGICHTTLKGMARQAGTSLPMVIADADRQRILLKHAAEREGIQLDPDEIKRAGQLRDLQFRVSRYRIATAMDQPADEDADVVRVAKAYEQALSADRSFDYDDLPLLTIKRLRGGDPLPPRVAALRYLFVDEYHDVSIEQETLLSLIAPPEGPRQMMIVADADQAIYSWRGADLLPLERFQRDYRPQELALNVNFRSTRNIVEVARAVMPSAREGYRMVAHDQAEDGYLPEYRTYSDALIEARNVAKSIQRAQENGHGWGDIAVLYRAHQQGKDIERELQSLGIPVMRVEPGRFVDQPDVQAMIHMLQLAVADRDVSTMAAAAWPTVLLDEVMLAVAAREAQRRGESLLACARAADQRPEVFGPLSRRELRGMAAFLDRSVTGRGEERVSDVLVELLEGLARRRSPFQMDRRTTHGYSAWDERHQRLFALVEDEARLLDSALRSGRPIVIRPNATSDAAAASCMLMDVLGDELAAEVRLADATIREDDRAFLIDLGRRVPPGPTGFGLAAMDGASATLRAYRICQFLLAEREMVDDQPFVLFDTETGDNQPTKCELVQAAVVPWQRGLRTGEGYVSRVRPSGPDALTKQAVDVHGLTWEMVSAPGVPGPEVAVPAIVAAFGDAIVVGHNVEAFDWVVIGQQCRRCDLPQPNNPRVDTLEVARRLFIPPDGHKLESYNLAFGFSSEQNHDAGDDAVLAGNLLDQELRLLRRDRELLALREYLPLVACSLHASGMTNVDDTAHWFNAGVRAWRCGIGHDHLERWVGAEPGRQADRSYLAQSPLDATPDDTHWQELVARWTTTLAEYLGSGHEPAVEAFLGYLALSSDPSPIAEGNEEDEPIAHARVMLMTVHSAKGKEWDLVYLIGTDDDSFCASWSNPNAEAIEEARRVLYVGMTRAKQVLLLSRTRVKNQGDLRPVRFLEDVPSTILLRKDI